MSYSRRDLFKHGMMLGGGMMANDILSLTTHITQGMISNAHAADTGIKKVISFYAEGACPTWMFNMCLYPHEEAIPSSARIEGLGTGFDNTGKTVFVQKQKGDYWFPKMWFTPIPRPDNTWVSPESLLMSMLTIRGMWNPTDGHQIANRMIYKPLGANYSVHGMIADAVSSIYPIPSVVSGNNLIQKEFTSPKGINPIGNSNPSMVLSTIQNSFKEQVSLFRGKGALDTLVSTALARMDEYSIFKKSSSNFNRKKADELVRANLATIITDYNTKRTKYASLLAKATKYVPADSNTIIPDIFDVPLTQYTSNQYFFDSTMDRYFAPNSDLRDLFLTNPEIFNIAESFAMAEVLIENNLTSNMICNISGMNTISPLVLNVANNLPFTSNKCGWGFDHGHFMGLGIQTLLWSVYFRGYITCLYEFVSYLKSKNLYEDSVISLNTDFARAPQASGKGSDHGWQANVTSFWSGEITTPTIVGNTYLDASSVTGANYNKLWGVGKKSLLLNNNIGIGNMNSTFATLAKAEANTSNNKTLIARDGGKIVGLEAPKTN